ncbi:MAG: sugar ABC transporter permease, partial [Lachnospiraceae bacterium]|nr:sugar ABC transporter permease [Lachnospiraceae bacterium]
MAKTVSGKKKESFAKSVPLLLIALPGIVYLLINNYIPIMGLFLAFKDFNFMKGIFKSDWCGLDNFKFLFVTKDAWIMTRNTILYNVAFIILGTIFAIFFAIILCELGDRIRVKFFQESILIPNLLSWVVIGF